MPGQQKLEEDARFAAQMRKESEAKEARCVKDKPVETWEIDLLGTSHRSVPEDFGSACKHGLIDIYLYVMLVENGFEKYREIMSQEIPYPEKVKQTILLKHETSKDISEEFLKDVYQGEDPGLKGVLQNYREKTTKEI